MQIIVKGAKGFEIFPENKEYAEEKFCKFQKLVKEPAVLEIIFEHTHGTRANIDKKIILNFTMPGLKQAEHFENTATHFTEAIDVLEEKFETFILRAKEKRDEERKQEK